jgi:hypothetical protein
MEISASLATRIYVPDPVSGAPHGRIPDSTVADTAMLRL